jgi:hypothetical protein
MIAVTNRSGSSSVMSFTAGVAPKNAVNASTVSRVGAPVPGSRFSAAVDVVFSAAKAP